MKGGETTEAVGSNSDGRRGYRGLVGQGCWEEGLQGPWGAGVTGGGATGAVGSRGERRRGSRGLGEHV